MKKHLTILAALFLAAPSAPFAAGPKAKPEATTATTPSPTPAPEWKKQVLASLNLTQGSFDNWLQGGTNFISWQAGLTAKLEQDNAAINWASRAKLEYGLTYVEKQGTKKSADNLELETVYSWKTWPRIFPFVGLLMKTQFDAGFDYGQTPAVQTSAFMDPGYLTESAGLKFVPCQAFNTRFGLAVKETFSDRFAALYGVDPGTGKVEKPLTQVGLTSVSELTWKATESSQYSSKLDLFWGGGALDRTVIQWDNLFSVNLNKILSVNLELDLRMDPSVYRYWQLKETLGIGLAYSLL